MVISKDKRKRMEKLIYDTFNALDPTGDNTEKYKLQFSRMDDEEFNKFFNDLFENENYYLILDVVDFERDLKMEAVEEAAKVLGIPLYEHVVMPYMSDDPNNPIVSPEPVPVGYLHLKPMQQMLTKKNSTSTEIGKRNKMNQTTGADKNARSSDMENYALTALEADNILKELLGPRADDSVAKTEMLSKIAKDGYVSMEDISSDPENKTALNMIDAHLVAMGLKSDLITKGLILKSTLNKK